MSEARENTENSEKRAITGLAEQRGEQSNNSINMAVFPLSKIKIMLKYKDIRSVIGWCRKNGVFVIQQGNAHFVNRTQFELAFFKPFIDYLKQNFENWSEQFLNYLGANYSNLITDSKRFPKRNVKQKKYSPKSNIEQSFLKKIKEL